MDDEPKTWRTQWSDKVNPERVLPEYPRPQMVRSEWLNLNGWWDYAILPQGADSMGENDGRILVPFPIESVLSGVQKPLMPDQRLWYRRSFRLPDSWGEGSVLLHFGAVDWKAEIWVNGQAAGEHTGGYYPFSFDITSFLIDGDNEITVAVWDPTDRNGQERGKQTLKPGGLFYTAVSGIWQTVWIEPVPQAYIQSHRLTPDLDNQSLSVGINVAGGEGAEWRFEAIVFEKESMIVSGISAVGEPLTLSIPEPRLWSPDSPFLYDLTVRLLDRDNRIVDEIGSYFGMRKFSIGTDREGTKRLLLNNEPLFQHGILDQGYWPDGLYTAPTDEALEFDIRMTKKLGFNMTRKHIKVEPARWYYHCDRHGLIVWQDMVNGGGTWNHLHHLVYPNLVIGGVRVSDRPRKALGRHESQNRDNYRKELREMIDALYNVPSIGMWVPFNEAWGQFNAAEIAEWVSRYDSTRTVDHASGWHDQGYGDIKSVHIYFRKLAMPRRIGDRAVVISEYGGYGLVEKGHEWREGKAFGYKIFKSRDELTAAYTSLIRNQLKPLIARGVCAAVYTQLTDVETEINGILSYDREVIKMDAELLYSLHKELISHN